MAYVDIKNLYKVFGPKPQEAVARLEAGLSKDELLQQHGHSVGLQNVSLAIEKGRIFVIMGLSGSGKSTLVRCINRLIEPTSGQITVDGTDILKLNDRDLRQWRRQSTGMVFQRFGLFPHRTVLQNIAYGLAVQGISREQQGAQARRWIERVGLQGWEEAYPSQLSGGMQQRVGIARALCNDPPLLFMDEPFSALDPLIRREMQEELMDLQGQLQKTIIFITHDLDEALRLGDRIAILRDGQVVQVGVPEEILTNPADSYVEDFTRGVNRGRVLKAQKLMVRPRLVISERDGPRSALRQMKEQGLSSVFVVDRERRYQGLVTADDAVAAAERGERDLSSITINEVPKTGPNVLLDDLLPLVVYQRWPVVVLDEGGVLQGVIPRVALLAALAGRDAAPVTETISVVESAG